MNRILLLVCTFCYFQILCMGSHSQQVRTQDQTSSRPNTLRDDADDIQRQLDNEARDRFKLHPKTMWIFSFPSKFPSLHGKKFTERFRRPAGKWRKREKKKPEIGFGGLQPWTYDITLYGNWTSDKWPVLKGGAANNRIYLFHSLTLHWPSEHLIEGVSSPLESQILYRSADYKDFAEAIKASSKDDLALLAVSTLYDFSDRTQKSLDILMQAVHSRSVSNVSLAVQPLQDFSPPFKQYVRYQGSLTAPPCAQALWLVRAHSLPIEREFLRYIDVLKRSNEEMRWSTRLPHHINDRKLYYFS